MPSVATSRPPSSGRREPAVGAPQVADMALVHPEMEVIRQDAQACADKERDTLHEAADNLILQCEECSLFWTELPAGARERVCRSIQVTDGARGYHGLADLLGVDDVDARFCSRQVEGQLKSSTELMLEHVERSRAAPLPAAVILRFLLQNKHIRVLKDVSFGVLEACARRRQARLLRRASDSSLSHCSPMESGYLSTGSNGSDIVGVVSAPPDATLVQAVPLRSAPKIDADVSLKQPKGKRLLLTYAADGREVAIAVAERLKALGFRLLLLEMQQRWRQPDPYTAVQKWFTLVDYVIPLLTPEYLAATQNRAQSPDEHARRLAEDARFVYSLMCAELEKNGHVNWRVRSLIPDGVEATIRHHPLFGSPLFRWPFPVSDLEELAECLSD